MSGCLDGRVRGQGTPPGKTPASPGESILVVDDDAVFRERLARALAARGYAVAAAPDGRRALEIARERAIDRAVIDLRMPGASGLELLVELLKLDPAIRIVVLTGYGSIHSAVEAMRLGARGYLAKPADADDVLRAMAADDLHHQPPIAEPPATLARAGWEHIQRILSDTGGNISETSRRLGITRRTLQLKIKKHGPEP
jgi:two-component system response regulator RegA